MGNGTDLTRFAPSASARRALRAQLGVGADQLVVGGVGRLVAEKGVHEFVATARALQDRAVFVWAGPEDPDKPDAVSASEGAVRFLGERPDMEALYNGLDVFVLPSYREGFSRSAMEAAATGLPMVLSDIRGCREVGRHGSQLLLVPPGDARALTTAVASLLDDPSLRGELGRAARAHALRSFDQRQVAAVSLRTYASVARRQGLSWTAHPEDR